MLLCIYMKNVGYIYIFLISMYLYILFIYVWLCVCVLCVVNTVCVDLLASFMAALFILVISVWVTAPFANRRNKRGKANELDREN